MNPADGDLEVVDSSRGAGGMPLECDGVLVGAVGVSGGTAAEDQRAVDAAIRAFG